MKSHSYRSVGCLAIIATLGGIACNAPSPQGTSADRSTLQREVSALWKDANVGTDKAYQQVLPIHVPSRAIAPADMREVASSIAGGRRLRKWPNELTFTCTDQRIRLSWTGEIANGYASNEALRRFDAAMAERGYRVLVEISEVQEMGQLAGLSAEAIDRWASSHQYHGYTRKVGDTEILALAEAEDYTGGRGIQSGVSFQWCVTRPYRHPQPTVDEALAALPGWFRAAYLPAAFYESLANETITEYGAGHGTSIEFENDVHDTIVKSLEDHGFDYHREHESRTGVQKTWDRYADATYAHVTMYPDSRRVRFHCQTPQRKGEPRTGKRPVLHPSLRLPPSKRPVLELDQLVFADPKLKQQTRSFQDLADGIAEEGWFVQRYKDLRHSAVPNYIASWETTRITTSYFPKSIRPYRAIHITLDGRAPENDGKQLVSLNVSGKWVPVQGWGAIIGYNASHDGYAIAGLVDQNDLTFAFDGSSHRQVIRVTQNSVSVFTRPDSNLSYEYEVRLPYDPTPPAAAERRRRFFDMFDSPETMRDAVLADIAQLRRIAADQMTRLEGLTVVDSSDVSSDQPPLRMPPSDNPPPEDVKKQLLDLVSKRLDSQEKLVRDSYQEIHAAMVKALPLNQVELP